MRNRDGGAGITEWGVVVLLTMTITSEFAAANPETNAGEGGLTITVRVNNFARLNPETVMGAIGQARTVFRKVGIETAWRICSDDSNARPPECRAALGSTELAFNVVGRRKPVTGKLGFTTCAQVFEDQRGLGKYGVIYADCLEKMPGVGGLLPSVMLGHLLTHEIGHLLLPAEDHAPNGVMRAVMRPEEWRLAMIGHLAFLPDQGERLRTEIRARKEVALISEYATGHLRESLGDSVRTPNQER